MASFAGIAINTLSSQLDKIFTYKIPDVLKENIDVGYRVTVPFGKGNKTTEGFVIELFDEFHNVDNIKGMKEITCLCDDFPLLQEKDIELIKFMREKYLCTYIEGIRVMIPSGISKGAKFKIVKVLYNNKPLTDKYIKEPYTTIISLLHKNEGLYSKGEFSKEFNLSLSSINTLITKEFIQVKEIIMDRCNQREYDKYEGKNLSSIQEHVFKQICSSNKRKFLIHGVTGSGKTEIYMHLVQENLQRGKQCIVLVPEISLTPQMIERFKGRFGKDIAIFHSRLSEGEKFDQWMKVKSGKVNLAIGARSAIFLPFSDLGLIILDEEHENTYKSESDPKYNTKEIAFIKSDLTDCKVVLGSATPSIESYYEALKGDIELLNIKERIDCKPLPHIEVVDMRDELMNNNKSIFSRELYSSIEECLKKHEQIILFLNRRGFSSFVSCRQCGYVFKCENCDISLTYHSHGELCCHYCGFKEKASKICPKCGSKYVKYFGVGTERIEEETKRYFPQARVIRMDSDTTRKKDSYENIYNTFKNGDANILIGTQMIAKGLDFPNVSLVGIIAADLTLNLPDFRASERTFQLITQVAGRAGRGEKEGKVVLQTYSADHFSIKYASRYDYDNFFKEEMGIRNTMDYPPFSKIFSINLNSENEVVVTKAAKKLEENLKKIVGKYDKIRMLGPCPCSIAKIKKQFRWQILIKGQITALMAKEIKEKIYEVLKPFQGLKISLDINSNNII